MKRRFLNFLILFLLLFFSFVFKAQSRLFELGDESNECDVYGTVTPCNTWLEFGCPEENYYGVGALPEENILYGSNAYQRTISQTCTEGSRFCSQGIIKYNNWIPDVTREGGTCNNNEYCDKNEEGFFCHLADECNPDNFFGFFPDESLSPKNNAYDALTPVGLDWCDIPGFSSYRIKLYTIGEETIQERVFGEDGKWTWEDKQVPVDVFEEEFITNDSSYCLSDLENYTTYKWQIAYCRGEDGDNCDSFQEKWKFDTEENLEIDPPDSMLSPIGSTGLPLTLEWESMPGAKSYYVEIYYGEDFSTDFFSWLRNKTKPPFWIQTTIDTKISGIYLKPNTTYAWRVASCAEANGTACGDHCCSNVSGIECGEFSGTVLMGSFYFPHFFDTILDEDHTIAYDETILTSPLYYNDGEGEHIPLVIPHERLEWEVNLGIFAYRVNISTDNQDLEPIFSEENYLELSSIWDDLRPNKTYSWTVTPCSKAQSDCQNSARSEKWYFQIPTGETETLYPSNGESNIPPSVTFRWEKAPGALSYVYEMELPSGEIATGTNPLNSVFFRYPKEAIGQTYFWRVKVCDGTDATYCRNDWHTAIFTLADFVAPSNPHPANNGDFFTHEKNISWGPTHWAEAYKYTLQYNQRADDEGRDDCKNSVGTIIAEGKTFYNYFIVADQTKCLGQYGWQITACLNQDCEGETRTSPYWTFNSIRSKGSEGGILPCNRISDNTNTSWDETETCQLKHVPIFFYNVLDFILWKASLIVFLFLIIASGVYSYAAAGLPIKIVSLKSIWIAAGKGYSVMFLAWTMINLALKVLGLSTTWLILPF